MFKNVVAVILIGAAIAIFFTLIKPLYADLNVLRGQKDSLNEALSNSREIQSKRDQFLSDYSSIPQENIQKLEMAIPSRPDSLKFILEIENVAKRNNVILKNVDAREEASKEQIDLETVSLSIKVSGSYMAFYSFLKDIESSLRLVDIKSINFTAEGADFYEFNIDASIYWKNTNNELND
jgi:Tfp pilus assembly protein PilO